MTNPQNGPVYVSLEFTPNPNTLKYSVNRQLLAKGAFNFIKKEEAALKSPLASKLMTTEGIIGVMIGKDFVTVTKSDDGDWDVVHKSASQIIETHLTQNLTVIEESALNQAQSNQKSNSELETKIKAILDDQIRPAVAMDGGDIEFDRFEEGVVYLSMQGSCAGCPSSTMTLKMGIETRLKEAIPEIIEVVAI